jgi:hypothetical protein
VCQREIGGLLHDATHLTAVHDEQHSGQELGKHEDKDQFYGDREAWEMEVRLCMLVIEESPALVGSLEQWSRSNIASSLFAGCLKLTCGRGRGMP